MNRSTSNETESRAAAIAMAFLRGRLTRIETISWAVGLKAGDRAQKAAVRELLEREDGRKLPEPWREAWRLVEQSWEGPPTADESIGALRVKQRVAAGDRTGALVASIVTLVSPRLELEVRKGSKTKKQKRGLRVDDLFRSSLTSPDLVTFTELGLDAIQDENFLSELAHALNASVESGLAIARRIGWDGDDRIWRLGLFHRVAYTLKSNGMRDIDRYHAGIAPSAKLLYATVKQAAAQDPVIGRQFAMRWLMAGDPIHLRLWAAISAHSGVTTGEEVGTTLLSLSDRRFWNLHVFPEIAELRAIRFGDIEASTRQLLARRIMRGPPASQWPRQTLPAELKRYKSYWSARELKRIEIGGHTLPATAKTWLLKFESDAPDVAQMTAIDEGFLDSGTSYWVAPSPDPSFDELQGIVRLEALESALLSPRASWDNDPSERAADWIRENGNPSALLRDLQSAGQEIDRFPSVWERLAWAHARATSTDTGQVRATNKVEADQFIRMMLDLSDATIRIAINGITHWTSEWSEHVTASDLLLDVWERLWPIAVETTNETRGSETDPVSSTAPDEQDEEMMQEHHALNTPAGRMVGVFLSACPSFAKGDENPFNQPALAQMRADIVAATGNAGLISRIRLIGGLRYFILSDGAWARTHLISPLEANDSSALALWRALGRGTQSRDVMANIGAQMAERATDFRLGRETRVSLLSSLIIDSLHSLLKDAVPAVPPARVQQTIRSVEDEVRARAAGVLTRFIKDMAGQSAGSTHPLSPEELFARAAQPFLTRVWPQERSLATPGVSAALADLPANTGAAFSDAVNEIDRFLVPFNCWSLSDYGFWEHLDNRPGLELIDSADKAKALLRLLDATVGTQEGSVVPYDLPIALQRVRDVAPDMASNPAFKRLSTSARGR